MNFSLSFHISPFHTPTASTEILLPQKAPRLLLIKANHSGDKKWAPD